MERSTAQSCLAAPVFRRLPASRGFGDSARTRRRETHLHAERIPTSNRWFVPEPEVAALTRSPRRQTRVSFGGRFRLSVFAALKLECSHGLVRHCNLKPQQRDLTPVLRRPVEPAPHQRPDSGHRWRSGSRQQQTFASCRQPHHRVGHKLRQSH